MRQTETYKLNLIDADDLFSPEPLNENMEKLDGIMCRFACGTYDGDGTVNRKIPLSFTPKVVYVAYYTGFVYSSTSVSSRSYYGGLALEGAPVIVNTMYTIVEIVSGGFQVSYYEPSGNLQSISANTTGQTYRWFAIG